MYTTSTTFVNLADSEFSNRVIKLSIDFFSDLPFYTAFFRLVTLHFNGDHAYPDK